MSVNEIISIGSEAGDKIIEFWFFNEGKKAKLVKIKRWNKDFKIRDSWNQWIMRNGETLKEISYPYPTKTPFLVRNLL